MDKVSKQTVDLFRKIAKVLSPPPIVTVSEWADNNRRLSAEASAEPGRWNTDRAPFQRDIMDAVNDDNIEEIVVMSSSQVGKTEILLNIFGYYADYDPSPMMLIQPTVEMGQAFSKDRLAPMIRDTPVLKEKIKDSKSRDGENTILHKKFPGGHITIVGANAPSGLASRPIKIVLCDEVDRYPASAGVEGDPIGLASKRTTTFWNRKKVYVSTPTIKGVSRIEQEYEDSTMEQWCVPCPACGKFQPYVFGQLKFDDVTMECQYCRERFTEMEWKEQEGKWIARREKSKKRGFHLNEMASPWKHWDEIINDWKKADEARKKKGSIEMLKTFINTSLGESWEEKGEGAETDVLLKRRERYNADLPDGVIVLTAGVDVQDNRFEIEVVGWAHGFESWGIQYKTIFCDLEKDESWERLEQYLETEFYFQNGTGLLIAATCLDTGGHFTTQSYKFLKKMAQKQKNIFGIKGMGGAGIPLIHKESTNNKEKVKIYMLGVDTGKETIMARLRTVDEGPGYCHFPINGERGYNEDYIKGLTSETRVVKFVKGKPRLEWVKKSGTRNEPLDLRNYATAAVQILSPNFEVLAKKVSSGMNYMKQQTSVKKKPRKTGVVNKGVDV